MEYQGQSVASVWSSTLELPPSCIEFSPAHPNFFVVGTYNLQKDEESTQEQISKRDEEDEHQESRQPQSRDGSLLVFKLDGNEV
jgi:diphthamide biosynthesis protein 7